MRRTGLQETIQSAFGGTPFPLAEVRKGEELAAIYGDWELTVPIANPVAANADGVFPSVYVEITADGPRGPEGEVVSVHKVNR